MSFNRRQRDPKKDKTNNLVAKHDHNVGGFHEKSNKALRSNMKNQLSKADILEDQEWEEFEEEWGDE